MQRMLLAAMLLWGTSALANTSKIIPIGEPEKATKEMLQAEDSAFVVEPSRFARGACDIAFSGQKSIAGRFCRTGYGVTFDGYFVNNSCYASIEQAERIMRDTRACRMVDRGRFCRFSYPDQRDRTERYCNSRWGVAYRGYINNNKCFTHIDNALYAMRNTQACDMRPRMGRCRIAMPDRRDDAGRYCKGRFGVMFRGRILDNTCFLNIDDAMTRMRSYRVCRR